MAIRCPKCKKEYDVTLFEYDKEIICDCGNVIKLRHEEIIKDIETFTEDYYIHLEEENLQEIQRTSEKIVYLILNSGYEKIDIEIEIEKFKKLIKNLFPEKFYLYTLIYEPRFKRLWQQFRAIK